MHGRFIYPRRCNLDKKSCYRYVLHDKSKAKKLHMLSPHASGATDEQTLQANADEKDQGIIERRSAIEMLHV